MNIDIVLDLAYQGHDLGIYKVLLTTSLSEFKYFNISMVLPPLIIIMHGYEKH